MAGTKISAYAKCFLEGAQKDIFRRMLLRVHAGYHDLVFFDDEDLAESFWQFAAKTAESFGVFGIKFLCHATSVNDKAEEEVYSFLFDLVQVLGHYETDRRHGDLIHQKEVIEEWKEKAGITQEQSKSEGIVRPILELKDELRGREEFFESHIAVAVYITHILEQEGEIESASKLRNALVDVQQILANDSSQNDESSSMPRIIKNLLIGSGLIAGTAMVSTGLAVGVAAVGAGRIAIDLFGKDKDNEKDDKGNSLLLEERLKKIDEMIGLEEIKNEIHSLVNTLRIRALRKSQGLPIVDISNHMVFYGNPGTGKTTVARELGKIYRDMGLLSKGHFLEVGRSDLVGQHVGKTALKTKEVLDNALGGILFIDEAYTLASGFSEDFGHESIDTILTFMENNRENIVIIAAGYQELMKDFIRSNPGLQSRFGKYLRFEDFSADELFDIFILNTIESNYILDNTAQEHLRDITRSMVHVKSETFGNGRVIRNLFENSLANQANRLSKIESPSIHDLKEITAVDISLDYALRLATGEALE